MNCKTEDLLKLCEDILPKGQTLRFNARGGSMYPFIRGGETVHLAASKLSELRYADIVFFRDPSGRLILHRLIKKFERSGEIFIITKGDSSPCPDDETGARNVLGKVTVIEKFGVPVRIDRGFGRYMNIAYALSLPLSRKAGAKRREDTLIRLLSRVRLDKNEDDMAKAMLGADLDWDYIFERSKKDGVACLLYKHLNGSGARIPQDVAEKWERLYYGNSARNAESSEELKRITKTFGKSGIAVITLKGLFLAEAIYGNIALRRMADIDILVKERDLAASDDALKELGYKQPGYFPDFMRNRSSINAVFYRSGPPGNFCVHLHRHILNSTWPLDGIVEKIDMGRVWSLAKQPGLNDAGLLTLAPEHLVIYLLLHALLHFYDRLILAADIRESLRHYDGALNWERVLEEAKMLGIGPTVSYSLRFASGAKCNYLLSYRAFLREEKGLAKKLCFIKRTIFPPAYVLAHALDVPASEIRAKHYLTRIKVNTARGFRPDGPS